MSATSIQFSGRLLSQALVGITLTCGVPTVALAQPRVTIDVGTAVACRDVTPGGFATSYPQEKVVEAKFNVSILVESGSEQDLEQLQIVIDSPQRRLRVIDFQPRTELASEMAGDVEVSNTVGTNQSLNASVGGVVTAPQGPLTVQASPAAGVGVSQSRGSKETFHRLSPKQLVLSSGTMNAEHGVFFKWKRSSQVTLEGWREVICRFRVPRDWRGDWMQFSVACLGRHHNYFGDKLEPCGQLNILVALALDGDVEAQQAARLLSEAQVPMLASNDGALDRGVRAHTVYKPATTPDSAPSGDRFALPKFKLCDNERSNAEKVAARQAAARAENLSFALRELERLSGSFGNELRNN